MANEVKINAESRNEFGKGPARRIRREGKVPAVLYGHGTDPVHVTLPGHEILLALRTANALLTLAIDGEGSQLALPKQIQRDPIRGSIEHVDLVVVRKGEKVTVEVSLLVVGEPADVTAVVNQDQQSIALEVLATNIPAHVEIDVTGLEIGDQITVADLKLPEGAVFHGSPDEMLVAIAAPRAEVEEPVAVEGEEAAEAAEDAE